MQDAKTRSFPLELFSKYRGFLMGFQILLIVIFHFTEDCIKNEKHLTAFIQWYYYNIGSSGVDLFLFFSGMGLYYSWSRHSDYKDFYCKRYLRVLVPYILVALPAWVCKDVLLGHSGILTVLKDFSFISFFTEGKVWFWYILAICFCYLLFPHFYRMFAEASSVTEEQTRFIVLAGGWLLINMMFMKCAPDLFGYIGIMLLRMPAFIAGVYLGKLSFEKREIAMPKIIVFSILLLLCQLGLQTNRMKQLSRFSIALFNLMICIWLLLLLYRFECSGSAVFKPFLRIFETLGKYSLEIYLLHVAVRGILTASGRGTYRLKYELVVIAATAVCTPVLNRLASLIISQTQKHILKKQ